MSKFRIQNLSTAESKLYSSWLNEYNKITGFDIEYIITQQFEDDVYENTEVNEEEIRGTLTVLGEYTNPEIGNLDMAALFAGNTIEIYIPFKEFKDVFGEDYEPKTKDKVKFQWLDKYFEVMNVVKEEREFVFNYHTFVWKIVLSIHKENQVEAEEHFDIEEETGKIEIKTNLNKHFFDSDEYEEYGNN